jgi:hypothetical protein
MNPLTVTWHPNAASAEISLGGHTGRTVPRLITAYPGKEVET